MIWTKVDERSVVIVFPPLIQNALRLQRQRERAEDPNSADLDDETAAQASNLKQASRKDMYSVCLNAGLGK